MYCKKCGQQLREGALFCGNCGTPTKAKSQKTAEDISRDTETSVRNAVISKKIEIEENQKKKSGKKIIGILFLCYCLLLAIGAGGFFLMHEFGTGKLEVTVTEDELEYVTEEIGKEDIEEANQEIEETEDVSIHQEETVAEDIPETVDAEQISHEESEIGIHTYELVIDDVTWMEAYQNCLDKGGHLVRINSDEEYQVILQQISEEGKENIKFWLGGTRGTADAYEYRWIYEDGTYGSEVLNEDELYSSYWLSGEPSFYDDAVSRDEMYMNMFYVSKEGRWVWNDVPNDLIAVVEFYSGTVGYICEYED